MDKKDFLKDIYDDFFGIEKLKRENEKLARELSINNDYPTIEIRKDNIEENSKTESPLNEFSTTERIKEEKDNLMSDLFEKIEKLYITEESKNILKKVIEYIRKYNEGIEKQYISFNMCIYSDNKETIDGFANILEEAIAFFLYVKIGTCKEISFYKIERPEELKDIYSAKNNIILFKDLEAFISQEQNYKDKFIHILEDTISENSKEFITIMSAKNKEMMDSFFNKNEDIKQKIFDFEIMEIKPDKQDVYEEVIDKLAENNELSDNFKIKLLDYISTTYVNTNMSFPEYRDKLCEKILFNKSDIISENSIPEYEKEKSLDEVFEELNELVGLTDVKGVLKDLVNLIELKNKVKGEINIKNTNLHMVFLGNPGTGKTTVARMTAEILYNLKYIKQNKLIEVSSKDLVAEYVGQTAPKTMAVIEKALGGILFIDEAYSLASGNGQGNSYNQEAIATLIQAMENYRDNLVVIFAGYTKEMQAFLNANSGIVSRIGYTLDFKDYTELELLEIFKSMVNKAGFMITNKALDKVLEIIRKHKNSKNFGNARFVRNVYEKTVIKHASNTKGKKSKKALKTIEENDISDENLLIM